MGHTEGPGQFDLEIGDVRPENETARVTDAVERRADLLTEHGILPVEREQAHAGKEAAGIRPVIRGVGVLIAGVGGQDRCVWADHDGQFSEALSSGRRHAVDPARCAATADVIVTIAPFATVICRVGKSRRP